jgi:hypothetical protein
MIQDRPVYIEDAGADCPVSLEMLGTLYRSEADTFRAILTHIPEHTRARLAAFLYSRSHTHELGLRVATTREERTLRAASGPLGEAIFVQSRQSYARPTYGETRMSPTKRVSLAGSYSGSARYA